MSYLSVQEKIQCLKNLLDDPDDSISYELLRLASEAEKEASKHASERQGIINSEAFEQ